jgi:hypothetical protein
MKWFFFLTFLIISGCAAHGFAKPGATYNEYLTDRVECLKMSAARNCVNLPVFNSCMNQKGWNRQEEGGFTPPPGSGVSPCD